jgi:regulatory protein
MNNLEKTRAFALKLLSQRAYPKAILAKKLANKYPGNPEEINQVLFDLERTGLINDQEFARNYLEQRKKTAPRGSQLLILELVKKGIDRDLAINLAPSAEEEYQLAQKALWKKAKSFENYSQEEQKAKLYRFLASRGFPSQVALAVIEEYLEE